MAITAPPLAGANPGRTRIHNRSLVLGHVRAAGMIGRAEIARATGLSTQAVSNIIADLEAEGLLREAGRRSAGRGLPVVLYGLNPQGAFALGVEVRPDAVLGAILNLDGQALSDARIALPRATPDRVINTLKALKSKLIADAGIVADKVLGAGVVMPFPIGQSGLSSAGTELPGWQDMDARRELESALDLPVVVENDANAAAIAERVSGAAQGLDSFAFIYFGTGLGLGLVSGGQLVRGAFGNAGEIGHIPVPGGSGDSVLEDRVSRLSVRQHMAASGRDIRDGAALTALWDARDPGLMDWLDSALPPLSHAVQTVENLFDPETIILGGAMPDAILDHLIGRLSLSTRSVAARGNRAAPRVQRGTSGRLTATLGAAALVLDLTFTPRITAA